MTQTRSFAPLALKCLLALGLSFAAAAQGSAQPNSNESLDWLRQAAAACSQIGDQSAADRARFRLQAAYLRHGDSENAKRMGARIADPVRRGEAHIGVARYYAETQNPDQCKAALRDARSLAEDSRLRDRLVNAYLELAESPQLAITFIGEDHDDERARETLCEALARHGHIGEALKIAQNETDAEEKLSLTLKSAQGAAEAARIVDTEEAVAELSVLNATEYSMQRVWSQLAEALYLKNLLDPARRYASLITNRTVQRKSRYLRKITDGVPPDAIVVRTDTPKGGESPLSLPLPTENPVAAARLLEQTIANMEKNPVESATGQFGPWDQEAQLARTRLQYAIVATLYRRVGNDREAFRRMETTEAAIRTVTKKNPFVAMLAVNDLQRTLIALNDLEGVRRVAAVADSPLWLWSADAIVEKVLSSGDIEGATRIASKALSAAPAFGGPKNDGRSTIISCFIRAGEIDGAYEVLQNSIPFELTESACEEAGRAMIQMDLAAPLRGTKWQKELGAVQRVYLSIGAASATGN